MRIQLSDHMSYGKLLRFVLPSIIMMIFTSIYGVVDGLFVSNFVGKTAFAAINLIMPYLMIYGTLGIMIGTGGSALVSKTLGEGKKDKANRYFSMLIWVVIVLGAVLSVIGFITLRPVAIFMGAAGDLIDNCVLYGKYMMAFQTAYMLQSMFQSFFVVAEKPKLGLLFTVLAGFTNIILDFLFVAVFKWEIRGAALATVISQIVGGFFPIIYFICKNTSLLRFVKTTLDVKALLKVCTNGSSELMTNISASLVSILYNFQLMKLAGENGIAAYGVLMYVNFIFVAIFFGYSLGTAPIIGYNFGAANHNELKNLFKKSIILIGFTSIILIVVAESLSSTLSGIFVGYDKELFSMTVRGFRIYSLAFLLCGFNIFGSAFFTALNNGLISAIISFLRTLVFQSIAILIMPEIWGIDGVWCSIIAAEIMSFIVTAVFVLKYKDKYKYI